VSPVLSLESPLGVAASVGPAEGSVRAAAWTSGRVLGLWGLTAPARNLVALGDSADVLPSAADVLGDVDLPDTGTQGVRDGVILGVLDALAVPGELAQPLPRVLRLGACHGRHFATRLGLVIGRQCMPT
jgi:hypothetical protein